MKKRVIAAMLAGIMVFSVTACGKDESTGSSDTQTTGGTEESSADTEAAADTADAADTESEEAEQPTAPVEIVVTTTFAGEDASAQAYKDGVKAWEEQTGNTVADTSASSDETFKTRVVTDFETGSEPDVLFFFNGADANSFIEAGKVLSIDEIRTEYPEYASNLNDDLITPSPVSYTHLTLPTK